MPTQAEQQEVLRVLDRRLRRAHGTPERRLGNLRDPLAECVFIILSFQTDVPRARMIWRALRRNFPTWELLLRARESKVAAVLRPGGLHRQKARAIRSLLRQVQRETGRLSLAHLHHLSDHEAERVLLGLHGLSWKGARCVMMYSLDRDVFPVDVNIFRIFKRMGFLSPRAVYRRRSLHDALQDSVSAESRRSLHINLVIHGQDVCLPARPRCSSCAVASMCRSSTTTA
jgi:endonuclease III